MIDQEKRAHAVIEHLCCMFNLPHITVKVRRGRSWFKWTWTRRNGEIIGTHNHRIIISPDREFSWLHEFAHYLAMYRISPTSKRTVPRHGPAFHRALTDVAEAWYGSADEYPWHLEYHSIAKRGPRKAA